MEKTFSSLVDKYPRVSDMVYIAKRRMPHFASEYLFAGTGYDEALENNIKVFNKIYLVPNYLKGTVNPNLKTKLFGHEYDAPFGMAPVGMTSLMWPGAEVALSKMSVKNNIPFSLSTVALFFRAKDGFTSLTFIALALGIAKQYIKLMVESFS